MDPQAPAPEPAAAPKHPLLRAFLVTAAQIAIPIAEQFLAAWLNSKGIHFPGVGVPNVPSPSGPIVPHGPAPADSGGSPGPATQPAPSHP